MAAGVAAAPAAAQDLTGAGATFPNPIYTKWFSDYNDKTGMQDQLPIHRLGRRHQQFTEETVDFGASDAPMSDERARQLKGPALHIPTVLGAVVITYNLPEVKANLKLTGPRRRRHLPRQGDEVERPEIAALNKGVDSAEQGHPGGSPLGRQRHDLHLHRLPDQGQSRRGQQGPVRERPCSWPVGLGGKGTRASPAR